MPLIPIADDVLAWRKRADETRAAADNMIDARCRRAVLGIAESYERMAEMARRRVARRSMSRFSFGFAGLVGGAGGVLVAYLSIFGLS